MIGRNGIAFSISTDHAALAGHFPGNPVVPAVVILECVAQAVRAALGSETEVKELPRVNFTAPLRPDETFDVRITPAGDGLAGFLVMRGATRIASGRLRYVHCRPQGQ